MQAIVVTHNSEADLTRLAANAPLKEAFERVIVVDNASADATCSVAAAAGFEVFSSEVNGGFAAGVNRGARETHGTAFFVLNPDVRFPDASVVVRLQAHLADPAVAIVAPALVLPTGLVQDSARRVPTPVDLVIRRLAGRRSDAVYATGAVDVAWVTAACVLVRRSAFESIGGLDERFFQYFEDVDFCVRTRQAGFRIRYDPTIRVFHDHRADSRKSVYSLATRRHIRSALRFYATHPSHLRRESA